jgi:hypothetical protein
MVWSVVMWAWCGDVMVEGECEGLGSGVGWCGVECVVVWCAVGFGMVCWVRQGRVVNPNL